MVILSCKDDTLKIVNWAEVVNGNYECSTTIGDLKVKDSADLQIIPSAKGSLNRVDLIILFTATNNKIDFQDISIKKKPNEETYLLTFSGNNEKIDGTITGENIALSISSGSFVMSFTGKKKA